jgi:subtilisin family serine protease
MIRRPLRALAAACALLAAAPAAASAGNVRLVVGGDVGGRRLVPGVQVVTVPATQAAATLRELRADPDVRFAARDGVARASEDPQFTAQWGLNNTGQTYAFDSLGRPISGTPDADIDAADAWAAGAVGTGVTVAVVDTRVQATHPDLAGGVTVGPDYSGAPADPMQDDYAHGTHVTGIIAARRGNGAGGNGVAPGARVVAYRALDDDGTGSDSVVAAALNAAAASGIRVVNASLGTSQDADLFAAVVNAHPNTLFVAAAGNDGADVGGQPQYPCALPEANVVCVGASDADDRRPTFSNFGAAVDVFAPGAAVLSTVPTNWDPVGAHPDYASDPYEYFSGTSMSAPMVSGIAALALSREPALTAAELRNLIVRGAEPRAAGLRANALRTVAGTADRDQDGRANAADACPDAAAASPSGCPDADADSIIDAADACPLEAAHSRNGCPIPRLRSLRVRVRHTQCRAHRRHCRLSLRVRILPTRAATVALRVERRVCRRHHCRYHRVYKRTLALSQHGRTLTIRNRHIVRGRYRIRLTMSSAAGRSPQATRRFRVR